METIKQKFRDVSLEQLDEIKSILNSHGDKTIGEVKLSQVYGGMRGILGLTCETSLLDANDGIKFRGFSIPELREKLPKFQGGTEPMPEALFYLMLIGEVPSEEETSIITESLQRRSHVPNHVFKTIDALSLTAHPMTQFVTGIMALQSESKFAKAYSNGISKTEYWSYTFEDSLDLIARIPRIAAYVYRRKYHNGFDIAPDGLLDWSGNFAHMLGYEDPHFYKLMRLYLTIHADHEGGNVSAHATHLVGSALADPYLSYAAGMNGLAGPLHGLANQEVVKWILLMLEELETEKPSKNQIEKYIRKTLDEGKVIPGYGHAVLRITDPRFTAQMDFGKKYMADDPLVNVVWDIYDIAPKVLGELGKVKNPWPNVDAHSGALLLHFGFKEYEFYTVLFAVSRALGVLASLCWDRALGASIERPKSATTKYIKEELLK